MSYPDPAHGHSIQVYEGEYDLQHPDGTAPQMAGFSRPQKETEQERDDSFSVHSKSPLAPQPTPNAGTYTPYPPIYHSMPMLPDRSDHSPGGFSDLDGKQNPFVNNMPQPSTAGARPTNSRTSSWDLLAGLKKFEHEYSEFDSRNASEAHLQFADGDLPKNKLARMYNYLLNVSIVTRWILFIVPVMALLWIPGIVGLTASPKAAIWNVRLVWWSIWLSVAWGGWWAALALARLLPVVVRYTVGVVAVATRRYIDWLGALQRYVALFGWTLMVWISFNPLIDHRSTGGTVEEVVLLGKLLFAFFLCASLLLFEKFSIQWIAGKFHERSYAERIADQKAAIKILVTLYANSSDIPGRPDTMKDGTTQKGVTKDTRRFFKKALKGVRSAATTTTTALGNVASEIAGSSVLQPNSPQAMVQTALTSANKTRLLARRLYYSFRQPGSDHLVVEDIARFFRTPGDADVAFAFFDKDCNGDASRDEVEMACMECHREQLSIEHSMKDLDSAVGRLDNILMSLYVVVAIIIIAVALEAQLATLITGAGTLVLGLSWLIGGSLAEVLTSIIFLFIKHPYDVGDRVDVEETSYTVKEIRLLSTIFIDKNGCLVQAPNTILNDKFIQNIRRSAQMSESFEFDVSYETTFEQIEALRGKMLAFVKAERRDFLPSFDVVVVDIPEQEKMSLSADIKYKSNWQQGALKVKRRNKWICALKTSLSELKIFGPKGNPSAAPETLRYTTIPWSEVQARESEMNRGHEHSANSSKPRTEYNFSDKNAVILDETEDVYGEAEQLNMANPRRGGDNPNLSMRPIASRSGSMSASITMPEARLAAATSSAYEMTPTRTNSAFASVA